MNKRHLAILALPGILLALLLTSCQPGPPSGPASGGAAPARIPPGLAVDPLDGSLLKASGGVYRSTDQGQSWKALPVPSTLQPDRLYLVATSAAAPSSIYAAGLGAGVVRSDDRGQDWRWIGAGLPSQEVAAFAVHSFRPDTIYAWIKGQGVFRTEDGGARWQKMDGGPPAEIVALVHSPLEGSMNTGWLYAATPEGPYVSMDCF